MTYLFQDEIANYYYFKAISNKDHVPVIGKRQRKKNSKTTKDANATLEFLHMHTK